MQVTPKHPPATAQAWPQNAGGLTARPPQEYPGHHQHHTPTGGQFDQPIADGADHQLAVNRARNGLQVLLGILLAEDVAVVRIDKNVQLVAVVEHDELGAAFGIDRWQVLFDRCLGIRIFYPLEQVVGRDSVMTGRHVEQAAVHQRIELRLEQVNGAGQGQHHHEWRNEQSGIEMPAPGQVVEIHFGLFHHVCSAWLDFLVVCFTVAAQPIAGKPAPTGSTLSMWERACPRCS
ncbi:hypothetical protein D3C73_354060 [compost metagenome]